MRKTSNQNCLLIGTSYSSLPFLFFLKKSGYDVTACGGYKSDPAHFYAKNSLWGDYSKPEVLKNFVMEGEFTSVIPTCNDISYMRAAEFAKPMGFLGIDSLNVARKLHMKSEFRKTLKELGLPSPSYNVISHTSDIPKFSWKFPLLVKPVDNSGGRGMTKVEDLAQFEGALAHALSSSGQSSVVVEEFVDGSLHSHSAFLSSGKISIDFFVDEFCTVYPYQVNCSNHPSILGEEVRVEVRNSIEKLAQELGLVDGLIHTQFLLSSSGPVILETMRRCPGDLYGELITRSSGADYTQLYLASYLGRAFTKSPMEAPKYVSRHTISSAQFEKFGSFSMSLNKEKNICVYPLLPSGYPIKPAPEDKVAIAFCQYSSFQELLEMTPTWTERLSINSYE